jgi:hypothetical protein
MIRGATALTNLDRLSSRRWQSFPTAPDGTGLTCGQHIESLLLYFYRYFFIQVTTQFIRSRGWVDPVKVKGYKSKNYNISITATLQLRFTIPTIFQNYHFGLKFICKQFCHIYVNFRKIRKLILRTFPKFFFVSWTFRICYTPVPSRQLILDLRKNIKREDQDEDGETKNTLGFTETRPKPWLCSLWW